MAKQYRYKSLATKILVVASFDDKIWSAFIGIVPGRNHDDEFMDIAKNGNKLREGVAKAIFPSLAENPDLEYID